MAGFVFVGLGRRAALAAYAGQAAPGPLLLVIPAKAGIQRLKAFSHERRWMFGYAEVKRSPPSRE
jgi:hypothetical protein